MTVKSVRKTVTHLCVRLHTSMEYFMDMALVDLVELIEEVAEELD